MPTIAEQIIIPPEIRDKKERAKCYQKQYQKLWWAENSERLKAHKAAYRDKHRERIRAGIRDHYYRNKERKDAQNKAYAKAHPHIIKKSVAAYNKRHPDRVKASQRKYVETHRQKMREKWHRKGLRRRARIRGSVINEQQINEFISRVRKTKNMPCYYCGVKMDGRDMHIDHVLALSRSGNHSVENLCAACPECNSTKHASLISEWKKPGQQILDM